MIANLSRVMFVIKRLKVAAVALAGSWVLVIVADVVLVQLVPPRFVVGALALGTTIGQTVVAIPLVIVTRRICGRAAVQGVGHAALTGLAAGAAATAVGVGVNLAVPIHHKLEALALAVPAAGCAIIAFGVVAYLLDDDDLRSVLSWVWRLPGGGHNGARRREARYLVKIGTRQSRHRGPAAAAWVITEMVRGVGGYVDVRSRCATAVA